MGNGHIPSRKQALDWSILFYPFGLRCGKRGSKTQSHRVVYLTDGSVRLFILAESLGGVESLIEHPVTMTHVSVAPDALQGMGITPDLVRVSVGIEDVEDLISDLDQALAAA